jgi:hypothetical protein
MPMNTGFLPDEGFVVSVLAAAAALVGWRAVAGSPESARAAKSEFTEVIFEVFGAPAMVCRCVSSTDTGSEPCGTSFGDVARTLFSASLAMAAVPNQKFAAI